jgi:hypothetical protein
LPAFQVRAWGSRAAVPPTRKCRQSPHRILRPPSDSPDASLFIWPAQCPRAVVWVCAGQPTRTARGSPYRTPDRPLESPCGSPQAEFRATAGRKSVEGRLRGGNCEAFFPPGSLLDDHCNDVRTVSFNLHPFFVVRHGVVGYTGLRLSSVPLHDPGVGRGLRRSLLE